MIFQSWRAFSSFMPVQILFYLFFTQYLPSLTEIIINSINYFVELMALVQTQKRVIFLGFQNLVLFGVLAFCFTWKRSLSNQLRWSLRSPLVLFLDSIQLSFPSESFAGPPSLEGKHIWILKHAFMNLRSSESV